MKSFAVILGFASLVLLSPNAANSHTTIRGSGNIIRETRQVTGFRRVSISGSGHFVITQGETESLEIECDDNIMPHIESRVANQTLEIGPKNVTIRPSQPIEYRLSLRVLESLRISGSLSGESGPLTAENFKVQISGSGSFLLESLEARSVTSVIHGSGEVEIESGQVRNQSISISGSGEITGPGLRSEQVEIRVSGSGRAVVWATKELNVSISGSGKIRYYGLPSVSSRVSGSGKVESLGAKF
jgi:hypothetical protein